MASRKALALIRAARENDPAAQLALGCLYLEGGERLAANPSAAFHWLARALEGGCEEAASKIAENISMPEAAEDVRVYEQACASAAGTGSLVARRQLGELRWRDWGGVSDRAAALQEFRRAAAGGDALAAARLGELLAVRPECRPEARRWLEQAAEAGVEDASRQLARLLDGEDATASLPWLRDAAMAGDAEAACRLGERLAARPGRTEHEGVEWLARAASTGHARASWLLGRHVVEGKPGATRSLKRAARLLELAATAGIAEAWWDLARLYARRGFSGRDVLRARQCLEAAARLGVNEARLELGKALAARRGDRQAQLEGGRWLALALATGEREAAPLLSNLADSATPLSEAAQGGVSFLSEAEDAHAVLAARLLVAAHFDLDVREALFFDLHLADQGWCLLADVGKHFSYRSWRLVLVENDAQRDALARLRRVLADEASVATDLSGVLRTRMRRADALLRRLRLDGSLVMRDWRMPGILADEAA